MFLNMPAWPTNGYLLVGFLILNFFLYSALNKNPIFKIISGIPLAIFSLSGLTLCTVYLGIAPPTTQSHIGLYFPFVVFSFLSLTNLTLSILKRITHKPTFSFLTLHIGLWIIGVSLSFGSGDSGHLRVYLEEKKTTSKAYEVNDIQKTNPKVLPFSLYLENFELREFELRLGVFDTLTKQTLLRRGEKELELKENSSGYLLNWFIEIKKLELSSATGLKAYIVATQKSQQIEGWISEPSPGEDAKTLTFDNIIFGISKPIAKNFSSEIFIFSPDGEKISTTLYVNKPYYYKGIGLYQTSYNTDLGKWSQESTIDLFWDPWWPFTYMGFFLTFIGLLLFLRDKYEL